MTLAQFLIAVIALLVAGICLPLPHGARMALILALIVVCVLTLIGGGMHFMLAGFR